jgi:hypothetical protein
VLHCSPEDCEGQSRHCLLPVLPTRRAGGWRCLRGGPQLLRHQSAGCAKGGAGSGGGGGRGGAAQWQASGAPLRLQDCVRPPLPLPHCQCCVQQGVQVQGPQRPHLRELPLKCAVPAAPARPPPRLDPVILLLFCLCVAFHFTIPPSWGVSPLCKCYNLFLRAHRGCSARMCMLSLCMTEQTRQGCIHRKALIMIASGSGGGLGLGMAEAWERPKRDPRAT